MNKKTAGFIFVGICIIIASLLLTQIVSPIVGTMIFAVTLVFFGGLSKGFKENNTKSEK